MQRYKRDKVHSILSYHQHHIETGASAMYLPQKNLPVIDVSRNDCKACFASMGTALYTSQHRCRRHLCFTNTHSLLKHASACARGLLANSPKTH